MKRILNLVLRRLVALPLVGLLALVVASACGANPNAPTSLTGTWTGTVVSSTLGAQAFQLTLTQSGDSITGFFTISTPGFSTSNSGALTGTTQGSALTLLLPTGTCGNLDTGTFNLTLE